MSDMVSSHDYQYYAEKMAKARQKIYITMDILEEEMFALSSKVETLHNLLDAEPSRIHEAGFMTKKVAERLGKIHHKLFYG